MLSRRLWTFERGVLWALENGAAPPAAAPLDAVAFGEITAEMAEMEAALAQAMELAEPGEIERRLAAGSRCFVAHVGNEIAGYGWVSRGVERIGELDRSLRMQPDEAYIWDCVTLPSYRRRGVYVALLGHMVSVLRTDGVRRVWIGAARDNHPSLRGFARAGFQPVATVAYVRALGLRHFWLAPVAGAPPALVAAARWSFADESFAADHTGEQTSAGASVMQRRGANER